VTGKLRDNLQQFFNIDAIFAKNFKHDYKQTLAEHVLQPWRLFFFFMARDLLHDSRDQIGQQVDGK